MSAEIGAPKDVVASAISEFCISLERDGYHLSWDLDETNGLLDAAIVAGEGACEECLVSRDLMRVMLQSALNGSGVSIRSLSMPKGGSV